MCTGIYDPAGMYRCVDCGRMWDFDDEPPTDCVSVRPAAVAAVELTDADKYRMAKEGE